MLKSETKSFGLFYAALMVLPGAHLIALGLWLNWRGFAADEIATIGAIPILARVLIAPLIAFWTDRTGRHVVAMRWLSVLTLFGATAMLFARSFWVIVLWHAIVAVSWSTLLALGETVTMAATRDPARPVDYGHARLWGSVSFMVAGFVAGALGTRFGPGAAMVIAAFGMIATLAVAWRLPAQEIGDERHRKRLTLGHAGALLKAQVFLLVLLTAGLTNAAHAVLYTFGTLHWQTLGYSPMAGSMFWIVSIVVEVALFARSKDLLRAISPLGLILLGAGAGSLRWFVMGFDPPLALILVLQMLHGLTYAATHIGAMQLITRLVVPEMAATAQTLYGTVALGLLMATAVRASGPIYATSAGAAYWLMALLSVAGVASALVLARRIGFNAETWPVLGQQPASAASPPR